MNIQLWIMGQIAIDLILVGVLVWLILSGNRRRAKRSQEREEELRKSEEILAEMRQIATELEGNLEEKRELTHHLLGRLDETLKRAEDRYRQFNDLFEATDTASIRDRVSLQKTEATRESIRTLMDKGLTRKDVARRLGISVGEIDLFLKLGNRSQGL
ncbi:MAG: hypothetical protein ACQET7_01275 [Thermodesulfobacteriota bacterium]